MSDVGVDGLDDRVIIVHPRKQPRPRPKRQIIVLVVPPEKVEATARAFPGSRVVTLRELGDL